ncbi:hypothetical protein [Sessilibacter corallicola]|uniref:hypothetical protein n=1 Tax=Sessilibacter corallicola TaxID=2904075 RepID=UPI001E28FF08|nr:hypothetical protein [Sessilibacter corallicola]MCE2030133.1 hypothetical protein [Sessilibacter corallicola]
MELQAKEHRLVILGLKKLLEDTTDKLNALSEESDEHMHLSNDAMLIDTMIESFQEEYSQKFQK